MGRIGVQDGFLSRGLATSISGDLEGVDSDHLSLCPFIIIAICHQLLKWSQPTDRYLHQWHHLPLLVLGTSPLNSPRLSPLSPSYLDIEESPGGQVGE